MTARRLGTVILLFNTILGLLGCHREMVPIDPDYSLVPVLFVHGSGLNSRTWKPMIRYLIGIGYPPKFLHAVDLLPRDGSNVRAANEFIAPAVESLLDNAKLAARIAGYQGEVGQKVDIVSHSMGAVSSRWYTARKHPERVRTWISIAGANHGTHALCSHSGAGNIEMCPAFAKFREESTVQVALNGTPAALIDETPYGLGSDRPGIVHIAPDNARSILYFTVRIEPDRWIKPETSALLDGAGGVPVSIPPGLPVVETTQGNYLFLSKVGHDPLPKNPELIRFVAALLAARNAQRVGP